MTNNIEDRSLGRNTDAANGDDVEDDDKKK